MSYIKCKRVKMTRHNGKYIENSSVVDREKMLVTKEYFDWFNMEQNGPKSGFMLVEYSKEATEDANKVIADNRIELQEKRKRSQLAGDNGLLASMLEAADVIKKGKEEKDADK